MRRLAALLVAATVAAGCGGGGEPRLITETVGSGPQTATIVRPDVGGRVPVVLFLHGWGATRPRFYRPWLDHLAHAGNAVIYPRYGDSVVEPPAQVLGDALAGVRLALRRVDEEPGSLVVAGHSAGGALAADYAAIARTANLPGAVAVFSAYPGRTLRGVRVGIPEIDPARIPAATDVVALAGSRDRVVGSKVARRIAHRTVAASSSCATRARPTTSARSGPTPRRGPSSGPGWTR